MQSTEMLARSTEGCTQLDLRKASSCHSSSGLRKTRCQGWPFWPHLQQMCNLCLSSVADGATANKCRVNLVMKRAACESWLLGDVLQTTQVDFDVDAPKPDGRCYFNGRFTKCCRSSHKCASLVPEVVCLPVRTAQERQGWRKGRTPRAGASSAQSGTKASTCAGDRAGRKWCAGRDMINHRIPTFLEGSGAWVWLKTSDPKSEHLLCQVWNKRFVEAGRVRWWHARHGKCYSPLSQRYVVWELDSSNCVAQRGTRPWILGSGGNEEMRATANPGRKIVFERHLRGRSVHSAMCSKSGKVHARRTTRLSSRSVWWTGCPKSLCWVHQEYRGRLACSHRFSNGHWLAAESNRSLQVTTHSCRSMERWRQGCAQWSDQSQFLR